MTRYNGLAGAWVATIEAILLTASGILYTLNLPTLFIIAGVGAILLVQIYVIWLVFLLASSQNHIDKREAYARQQFIEKLNEGYDPSQLFEHYNANLVEKFESGEISSNTYTQLSLSLWDIYTTASAAQRGYNLNRSRDRISTGITSSTSSHDTYIDNDKEAESQDADEL